MQEQTNVKTPKISTQTNGSRNKLGQNGAVLLPAQKCTKEKLH